MITLTYLHNNNMAKLRVKARALLKEEIHHCLMCSSIEDIHKSK